MKQKTQNSPSKPKQKAKVIIKGLDGDNDDDYDTYYWEHEANELRSTLKCNTSCRSVALSDESEYF